jgi:PASTA domain
MKRRVLILTVLVLLAAPVAASGGSSAYGVAIRGATVNLDRSVTITWSLEYADVLNSSVAVDGAIVRSGSDRAITFTTGPLSGGWHTITIEAHEFFETYSPVGSLCQVSGGHYVCARSWRSSTSVSVPYVTRTYCVVPRVVGLQLKVAMAQIRDAKCSLGAIKRVHSKQRAGTVLRQQPTATRDQLETGAAISFVVSNGRRRASARG